MKYVIGIMVLLYTLVFASVSWAACTGCGEGGHGACEEGADHSHETVQDHGHIEGFWLDHKHEVTPLQSPIPTEVVFAVCVFADGTLIDHKGADSMSDCLKTKREVQKKWRNRAATTDTVEINGITYQIDGESLAFMCDLVDAQVHHYADGTWEIIEIIGKHKEE